MDYAARDDIIFEVEFYASLFEVDPLPRNIERVTSPIMVIRGDIDRDRHS